MPCASIPVNLAEVVITRVVKVLRKPRHSKTKPGNWRPTRKKKKEKDGNMWILLSCQRLCLNFRNLYAVTKTPHQRLKQNREEEIDANMWFPLSCQRSHPIMSSIACKMRSSESCLVLWFLNTSEFLGY